MPRASLWQLNVTLFVIYKTFILYIINNERVGFPIGEICTSPTFRLTFSFSLERRWSSRTFWYGYLVTTSPQSLVLPSTAASQKLAHRLRVFLTLMVWRAVCTRPGNVFTAVCWPAITSNSGFMKANFSLQSELRLLFWVLLHLAVSLPSVTAIVVRV